MSENVKEGQMVTTMDEHGTHVTIGAPAMKSGAVTHAPGGPPAEKKDVEIVKQQEEPEK